MIQSMTGYASSIIEISVTKTQKISLSVHLKSLNSRYFEATCKVPYLLHNLEVPLQRILKKDLHRGHAYLSIKVQNESLKHSVIPSMQTVDGYLKAINAIKKEYKIQDDISLETLLKLPNILQVEEEALSKKTEELIVAEVEKTILQLVKARITEGKVLAQDIKTHTATIDKKLTAIQKASAKASKEKKDSLDTVISKLQSYAEEELCTTKCVLENQKSLLISEIEKMDINEEIVRAHSHIKNIQSWLVIKEPVKGKKLDFIFQELNREVNTIASKCSNFTISSLAIDIKTELEKCREQAQNIV